MLNARRRMMTRLNNLVDQRRSIIAQLGLELLQSGSVSSSVPFSSLPNLKIHAAFYDSDYFAISIRETQNIPMGGKILPSFSIEFESKQRMRTN